ncbi:MAG: transcriptional regulator [Gammaproteobacteria bacterium]
MAEITGIPQSTLSASENNRINLGVERAQVSAKTLRCHPAVLVFPGWEIGSAAAQQRDQRGSAMARV